MMSGCFLFRYSIYDLQEVRLLRPDVIMEGIEGGPLVAARSVNALCFFDWETGSLIRRIEISAKHVYWSDNAEMVYFKILC